MTDNTKKNKNTFNLIGPKEWLPFQKSWVVADDRSKIYRDNIRFFTLPTINTNCIEYQGDYLNLFASLATDETLTISHQKDDQVQFVLFDWMNEINGISNLSDLVVFFSIAKGAIETAASRLIDGRFMAIFAQNIWIENKYIPVAWDLAKTASHFLSLRDEKIMCFREPIDRHPNASHVGTSYAMYLCKDPENTSREDPTWNIEAFCNQSDQPRRDVALPSWFILKPQRRKADEVLHPAKYPEELVTMFISEFTEKDQNVFDPMSGTGSTQVGALRAGRNAYGTELSEFFWRIANNRLSETVNPTQMSLFGEEEVSQCYRLECGDARRFKDFNFPHIDYLLTSPPYWDMLNMKGAETQAKRQELGLRTNYSESAVDLGNQADYEKFLDELVHIYSSIFAQMGSGRLATIVVKNIKKKGVSYPFAWDLSHRLTPVASLIAEHFWLQDDISIFPFAFGRTWVSNTFHQYCLTYRIE